MLKANKLLKVFNKGTVNEKLGLNRVTLDLNKGDFVTVIGSNGAGKSTLLNAIAGNFMMDGGTIQIDSTDITNQAQHQRASLIGRVFQDPMLGTAASMTIEENLVMALRRGQKRRLCKAIGQQERTMFREELKKLGLGLEDRLTNKVNLLSGGQRQAVTLLMSTLREPKILLLDEHTAALDPKTAATVLEITAKVVKDNNLTSIMITHNLDNALGLGNRTIMMHEGRIILDIKGAERESMTISHLMSMFEKASGAHMNSDKMLLA